MTASTSRMTARIRREVVLDVGDQLAEAVAQVCCHRAPLTACEPLGVAWRVELVPSPPASQDRPRGGSARSGCSMRRREARSGDRGRPLRAVLDHLCAASRTAREARLAVDVLLRSERDLAQERRHRDRAGRARRSRCPRSRSTIRRHSGYRSVLVTTHTAAGQRSLRQAEEVDLRRRELLRGVGDEHHRVGAGQGRQRGRRVRRPQPADAGRVDEHEPALKDPAGQPDLDHSQALAVGRVSRLRHVAGELLDLDLLRAGPSPLVVAG